MKEKQTAHRGRRGAIVAVIVLVVVLAAGAVGAWLLFGETADTRRLQEKTDLLKPDVLTEEILWELGTAPAGKAGHVVMLSVSDTASRAMVFTGTGMEAEEAWENAVKQAKKGIRRAKLAPQWVRVDVVYEYQQVDQETFRKGISEVTAGGLRYGVAFDPEFKTALLETELNSAGLYDYENDRLDLDAANRYLKERGAAEQKELPNTITVFRTFGSFCDEQDRLYSLNASDHDIGRRKIDVLDAATADVMLRAAAEYLTAQVLEDGRFTYGVDARFGTELESYNILHHAGTLWSMTAAYARVGGEELAKAMEKAAGYLASQVVWQDAETAFVLDAVSEELKLGASALAVTALSSYDRVMEQNGYETLCAQLGSGIVSMLDPATGIFSHVLYPDFTQKELFHSARYDGEAAYALCCLYEQTGDSRWLEAAQKATDVFVSENYTHFCDQWVSYTVNALTQHVENSDYCVFALHNAQKNYATIGQEITAPMRVELLLCTFDLYDRLLWAGSEIEGFDGARLMQTISDRVARLLDGCIWPETAMYLENPAAVCGAFMVREDGFRVRIDDVQHAISALALYAELRDRMILHGLPALS